MGVRPHRFDELDQIGDIVIEPKIALAQRNLAGVFPVGDIGIEIAGEAADGILQQCGMMARQGGRDQHFWLLPPIIDREMQQVGKGQALDNSFLQANLGTVQLFPDLIARLGIVLHRARGQFPHGRKRPHCQRIAQGIAGIAGQLLASIEKMKKRTSAATRGFIGLIDQLGFPLMDIPDFPDLGQRISARRDL